MRSYNDLESFYSPDDFLDVFGSFFQVEFPWWSQYFGAPHVIQFIWRVKICGDSLDSRYGQLDLLFSPLSRLSHQLIWSSSTIESLEKAKRVGKVTCASRNCNFTLSSILLVGQESWLIHIYIYDVHFSTHKMPLAGVRAPQTRLGASTKETRLRALRASCSCTEEEHEKARWV